MSSCGNPSADDDGLMPRRLKFDKGRCCIKCKSNPGNIVIRHAVYCRECFTPLVTIKFRKALEPHVNANVGTSKRLKLKASGSLALGFSGGLGSSVLLNLVQKTYFTGRSVIDENGEPRGGTKHPRNTSVWSSCKVFYIEVSSAFPGARDRTNEIRSVVASYANFEFLPLRLEDAFDRSWWSRVSNATDGSLLALELGKDGLLMEDLGFLSLSNNYTPTDALRAFLAALPTPTAVSRAVHILIRLLLLYTARSHGASHLLLGTCLTSLSVSLISCIAQGGGHSILGELHEEWPPSISASHSKPNASVHVVRPLRDVTMKECAAFAWWNEIRVPGRSKLTRAIAGIPGLTKDFIVGLEKDYPSTVSTIARTCAKVEPKRASISKCTFCHRPLQEGLADWKSQISVRSYAEPKLVADLEHMTFAISTGPFVADDPPYARSFATGICYACSTMLTSRSSRRTGSISSSMQPQGAPLPLWADLNDMGPSLNCTAPNCKEIWVQTRQSEATTRGLIAEFLLPDS
ncbi:hypothetical protein ID866_3428 [Astraeus odoratus]|nr:hypothetical protein ID866_3428 [Astraeus odoratus]